MSENGSNDPPEDSDDLPEDIIELAEEYLDLVVRRDDDPDSEEGGVEELNEELEYWNDQIEELDEDDELYSVAVSERDEIQEQLQGHETKKVVRENVRRKLAERVASDFVAKNEWLTESVIQAITHRFLGAPREQILIDEFTLPQDEIDGKALLKVSRSVRAVAQHEIDMDNRITELWDAIEGTNQYPIVKILADESNSLGPTEVRERLDEDVKSGYVSTYIGRMTDRQYHPYFGLNGEYTLSFVGEYIWKKFGGDYGVDGNKDVDQQKEEKNGDQSEDSDLSQFSDS